MAWRLRVVDPGGATVAECALAPEAIFGAPTHRVLGGRLVLPSPPEGRVLTGEFRIEDPSGKVRTQPIASPRFLEGSHKPRVRFTTARGDVVIELERLLSPAAVEAFLDHVRDGDYSGAIFHELREDQFVKGGVLDAKLEPVKPPRRPLPPEWIETRPKPTTSKMTVALTGHAEFMIHVRDNPNLAILKSMVEIGKVVEGQDLIAAIAREPVVQSGDQPNAPVRPLAIEKAEVVEE
jgi:cyclophilin family peptidyl-prolyl cis-trans isomerase